MDQLRPLALLLFVGATGLHAAPRGALLVSAPDGADEIERAARAAIGWQLALDDAAATAAQLDEARQFGLSCDTLDVACATSFAQLVGLDEVVTVVATDVGGARFFRVTRVSKATPAVRAVGGRDDVAAVVGALFSETPLTLPVPVRVEVRGSDDAAVLVDLKEATVVDGVVWVTPGHHAFAARSGAARSAVVSIDASGGRDIELVTLTVGEAPASAPQGDAPAAPPVESAPPPPSESFPVIPTIAVVGGAVVGAVGAAVWVQMDAELGEPLAPKNRSTKEAIGLAGVTLVAVGVVAVGFGALGFAGGM